MALNIGNVNFGVDATTAGLQKAINKMEQFAKVVNKTAKSQTTAAQQAASAMARQESAIKKAFQQTLNLQQQMRKYDMEPGRIGNVSKAFATLTKEMTSGKLSMVEYTRSLDAFNTRMGRTRRVLNEIRTSQAQKEVAGLTEWLRNLESASVLAVGPLIGLGARIRSLAAIFARTDKTTAFAFAGAAAGLITLGLSFNTALTHAREFEASMARFTAATGSIGGAAKEMQFTLGLARELGLNFNDLAKSYSRFSAAAEGTKLAGEGGRVVFAALAEAAAALRLETTEVEGAFRAVEQMISKGSVQAEELRGQLGERLPGAFRLAAESMGYTTERLGDLLKTGQISTDYFLPLFAKKLHEAFGPDAANNINSITGATNNMTTEWSLFWVQFNEVFKISELYVGSLNAISKGLSYVRKHLVDIVPVLAAVAGGMLAMAAPAIIVSVYGAAKAVITFARSLTILSTATQMATRGWLSLAMAAAGAAAAFYGTKRMMEDIADIGAEVDNVLAGLNFNAAGTGGAFELSAEKMRDFLRTIDDLRASTRAYTQTNQWKRYMEDVLQPTIEFQRSLADTGASLEQINATSSAYYNALKDNIEAQEHYRNVTLAAENATNDFLESALFRTNNLKDAIKDLGAELIKIAVRNAIITPLAGALGNFVGGIGMPAVPSALPQGTGYTPYNPKADFGMQLGGNIAPAPNFAHGGSFTVGGSGGTDSQAVRFNASPGEHVEITPGHRSGKNGGGTTINLTVNAPGADAGTIGRLKEIIASELGPQLIAAATNNTMMALRRPRYT